MKVFTPIDLINARTLSSVINSFFGTSQLSQFLDQTNPLSEITHKRRISALGPGGLSGSVLALRCVTYTTATTAALCTIETPEGPNIGLISTLCVHAKVNKMGFLETPYRRCGAEGCGGCDPIYLICRRRRLQEDCPGQRRNRRDRSFTEDRVSAREHGDFPVLEHQ
jgi:DNA-directed RNA polymerase subunit beta